MNPENSNHLNYGRLIALAHLNPNLGKDSAEMLHINECAQCDDIYKYSASILNSNNSKSDELFIIDTCPASDMDYIDLLLTIINNELADEHTAKIFEHFNSCNACYKKFGNDWTAYVSVNMN